MADDREGPLDHLRRDQSPPPALKGRVRRSLRSRGLLARPGWVTAAWSIATAAIGVVLFTSGVAVGRGRQERPTTSGSRYALLLYEPSGFDHAAPESSLVAEYRDWAYSLGEDRLSLGEKLGNDERVLRPGSSGEVPEPTAGPSGPLGGLFIIRAESWDEALKIARTCPHLRHGGVVAVKRVEET